MRRLFPLIHIGSICSIPYRNAASTGRLGSRLTLLARPRSLHSRSYVATRDPPERRKPRYQSIATLDPARSSASDALDLSDIMTPTIQLPTGSVRLMYHRTSLLAHSRETHVPFTAEAIGFLYFHASSCSLRFRVVPSRLPEDFDAGRDLLLPNGVNTWCVRTSKLARGSTAAPLRQQVLDDGLVTASTLQVRACIITTLDRRKISDRDLLDLYGHRYTAQPRLVRPNGDVLRLFISRKGVSIYLGQ